MSEQATTLTTLDKTFAKLIEGATEKGAHLVDWLYEQAPDVIQQFLLWHGIESLIRLAIALILIIGGPILTWKLAKWWIAKVNAFDMQDCDRVPLHILPTIFGAVIITLVTQINGWGLMNFTWLKIWLAPKVFLLEYVATMVK